MNTNCVNCGAALEIDQLRQIKHCPYCGAEVEIKDETPDTMAGTIHGIAKTFFNQTADKIRYNREHAVEIAEYLCFSSDSHFSRVFREHVGLTPTEYRKRNYQRFWNKDETPERNGSQ